MKVVQALRRVTTTLDSKEIVINKGDYVLTSGTENDDILLNIGMHTVKKTAASFKEIDLDIPEMYRRFTVEKFQQLIKLFLLAKEKKFTLEEKEVGRRLGSTETWKEEDILPTFETTYEHTTTKRVIMSFSQCLKSLKPDAVFIKDNKPLIAVSNRFQAVVIDLMGKIDDDYIAEFEKMLSVMKELTEAEKRTIIYKKLADKWNSQLKDRKVKLEQEHINFRKKMEQLMLDLTQNVANVRNTKRDLENVSVMLQQDGEAIAQKIAEVEAWPFVKSTEFRETTFIVHLKDMELPFTYSGHEYNVPFNGLRLEFTPGRVDMFHNDPVKTNSGGIYYHPHISGPDKERSTQFVCFGEGSTKVASLLAERKFKELAFMCRSMLGGYNKGDALLELGEYLVLRGLAKKTDGKIVPVKEIQKKLAVAEEM